MYFLHQNLVDFAVEYFNKVEFATAAEGDAFWGLFAPGNTVHFADRPFERFSDYEEMLNLLRQADQTKYERMHKGTPFYLMSWLAFDLRNYEKGLFYMDSTIAEDIRKTELTADPESWKNQPGTKFLLLAGGQPHVAQRSINRVQLALQQELARFNGISGQPAVTPDIIRQFVTRLIEDLSKRTIVSALYVFLLESFDRKRELELRQGSSGGSNQPFTLHLFTGGLLLESLLKHYYPISDNGQKNKQLGRVYHTTSFQTDFGLAGAPETSADTLQEIHDAIAGQTLSRRPSAQRGSCVIRPATTSCGTTFFPTRDRTRISFSRS